MNAHLNAPETGAALGTYVRAIRSRWVVFALVTVTVLAAAALVLAMRTPSYEATSELLITPLQQDDSTFLGMTVLRDSGDPTRTAQTAAALISSPDVARRAAQVLGGGHTAETVQDAIDVQSVGESNILGITAKAAAADDAANLANRYADSALALRSASLRTQILAAIARLRGLKSPSPLDLTRLSELRAVRDRGDPSLSLAQSAVAPDSPTNPPALLTLALALIAGLTLGAVVALVAERLDRRVRDADQLFWLAPVPVLARVPTVRRRDLGGSGLDVPPAARESFRTLQLQLDKRRSDDHRTGSTIVVTSPSRGDGKTTTAISLSLALVASGHEVILIDCDLRRPDIGSRLGLDSSKGLVTLLSSPSKLVELLQPIDRLPPLRVLTAAAGIGDVANLQLLTRRVAEIFAEARSLADYVVVDTAPLGVVGDALALTPHADEVLLVGRMKNSDSRAIESAVELLDRANTPPSGWVVIGDDSVKHSASYREVGRDETDYDRQRRRSGSPVG